MAHERLIDANYLDEKMGRLATRYAALGEFETASHYNFVRTVLETAPTMDAIFVTEIKDYLQARLDEWNALGDRKFEPANMWGYNFIMACFDDLERRGADDNRRKTD